MAFISNDRYLSRTDQMLKKPPNYSVVFLIIFRKVFAKTQKKLYLLILTKN